MFRVLSPGSLLFVFLFALNIDQKIYIATVYIKLPMFSSRHFIISDLIFRSFCCC